MDSGLCKGLCYLEYAKPYKALEPKQIIWGQKKYARGQTTLDFKVGEGLGLRAQSAT